MRLVKIIFGMMGLAAMMLIASSAEARPCFTNPSKGCKGIKVLEDSEAWFFDNVLDEKGEFRFRSLEEMHIHNEFNGLEYVVQRVVYERLGCLNIRAREYEYAFHDIISKTFARDYIVSEPYIWDYILGFMFSEDRRFILQNTISDHYLLSNYGTVIADTKTRKLIFVIFHKHNLVDLDWSAADEPEKRIYYNLNPTYRYDPVAKKIFQRHHMFVFMPSNYSKEDWRALLPVINEIKEYENSYSIEASSEPSKTFPEDVHFHAINCRQ